MNETSIAHRQSFFKIILLTVFKDYSNDVVVNVSKSDTVKFRSIVNENWPRHVDRFTGEFKFHFTPFLFFFFFFFLPNQPRETRSCLILISLKKKKKKENRKKSKRDLFTWPIYIENVRGSHLHLRPAFTHRSYAQVAQPMIRRRREIDCKFRTVRFEIAEIG